MTIEESLQAVGLRVRMIRDENRISQEDLGHRANLTGRQHISRIEAGSNMRMSTVYKIATALEVSMAFLLDIHGEIKNRFLLIKEMDIDIVLKRIGEHIMDLRNEKNLRLNDVGERAHKDKWSLSRRENGTVDFTLDTLYRISVALNESMASLVDIHHEIKKNR
jgi:transcriptional regulator with XRE-family HTH domain